MKDPKVPVPDSELRKVALLTAEMRHYEQVIADLAEQRRVECLRLNKPEDGRQKVTYERLAQAMGISDVAVYKILKRGREDATRDAPVEELV